MKKEMFIDLKFGILTQFAFWVLTPRPAFLKSIENKSEGVGVSLCLNPVGGGYPVPNVT